MRNIGKWISSITLPAAIVAAGLGLAGSAIAADTGFRYNGDNGPGFWSALDAAFGACAGTTQDARQSPINIDHPRIDPNLKPLELRSFPTTIRLVNNGHAIEQEYEGTGSAIDFEGKTYELLQFHFHTLSEHAVDGLQGDMELHAVFQVQGGNDKLVVGVLFEVGKKNENNPFLQVLIDAGLPRKEGNTTVTFTRINLADVLTSTSSYFTYPGSLTTPPCTENVTWIVLAQPANLSQAQAQSFSRILGNDFRPLQGLNGRTVRSR